VSVKLQPLRKTLQINQGVREFDLGKSREFPDSNLDLDYGETPPSATPYIHLRLEMYPALTFQFMGDLMKRIIIIASLLACATQTFAAPVVPAHLDHNARLVSADSSALSEICIAAVESRHSAIKAAAHQRITNEELDQVYCNGMPLVTFVRTVRALQRGE
jgi:hypothetical protein